MLDITLRPFKDRIFAPIARTVPPSVTPMHLTSAGFLCGLGACFFAAAGRSSAGLFLWLLNRVLDCLDGSVARCRGQASDMGGFADLLADFIVYSLIPISCAIGNYKQASDLHSDNKGLEFNADALFAADLFAVALLEASFHINNFVLFYTGAMIEKAKAKTTQGAKAELSTVKELTSIAMRPALVEGLESGVFFTLMLLLPNYIYILSFLMLAGVVVGTTQRIFGIITLF
jgi:CDP-alcohol phosphatidyltransferase